MCMITVVPAGISIPVQGIMNGGVVNDDGHGWAVASKDGVVTGKSMELDIAVRDFIDARDLAGESSVGMFHSRWGTHGIMGEFNVHPFDVTDHSVVAHNGILPRGYLPDHGAKRSDTRIFVDLVAKEVVDRRTGLPSRRSARRLAEMIGTGNKLAFLAATTNGPKVRLVNAWAGVFTSGVWYSNSGYKPSTWTYGNYRSGGRYAADLWDGYGDNWGDTPTTTGGDCSPGLGYPLKTRYDRKTLLDGLCPRCYSDDLAEKLRYCRDCFLCLDCEYAMDECLCHYGADPAYRDTKAPPWWTEQYGQGA